MRSSMIQKFALFTLLLLTKVSVASSGGAAPEIESDSCLGSLSEAAQGAAAPEFFIVEYEISPSGQLNWSRVSATRDVNDSKKTQRSVLTAFRACKLRVPLGLNASATGKGWLLVPGGLSPSNAVSERPAIDNIRRCAPSEGEYPREARMRNEEGRTTIRFTVDMNGRLLLSQVVESSGSRWLDAFTLYKLSNCKFTAGRSDMGEPVCGSFVIQYVWRL
jgi:TonB family protein